MNVLSANQFFEVLAIHHAIQLGGYKSLKFRSLYELNLKVNNSKNRNSSTSRALSWLISNKVLSIENEAIVEDADRLKAIIQGTEWFGVLLLNKELLEPKRIESL